MKYLTKYTSCNGDYIFKDFNFVLVKFSFFQVQVIVEDENDNAPVFDRSWYSGRVREDCPLNCVVALEHKIRARDADSGNNAEFSMTLHGEDSELFYLDPDTGSIAVKAPLDRELKDTHKLWIIASDKSEYM